MRKLTMEELGRPTVSEYRERRKLPVVVLLDNVRSLHNVGSAFRTCDAFGMERLVLTGITGQPPHREIHKTALGATESVAWEYEADPVIAVKKLKDAGYRIVVVEQTTESVPLHACELNSETKYCLVFGNEVRGVGEEVIEYADMALEVPQAGTKHSLNISVCLGVVCWEFFKMHVR
ncbi:MAG: RNA methyltransferase [Bacteroidota bacterium]|jgi:23S rRNA (guanosine2251-2'-O)-methyltransferase|nr:MAG: RNA methyltransferase [Bacteroidota bacterium]